MPFIIQYFIKFSISLAVVYLFYQLSLRRLTFYNSNRWYLMGYVIISFALPFINISPIVEKTNVGSSSIIQYIPVLDKYTIRKVATSRVDYFLHLTSWWNLVLIVLMIGSLILLFRLCIQFISLKKMKDNATRINQAPVTIYHVEKSIIPFSFGNDIYINRNMHTEKEIEEIILHEYVHVKQKHTADIMIAEFLCIFNWYNPFAWLIRKAIKQNLEFIADNQVLQTGLDKKNYQYHLLKVTGMPRYGITSNFNFSSLKKRITMMNKMKTAKVQLLRFLFLVPLVTIILLAFRNRTDSGYVNKIGFSPAIIVNDSIPSKDADDILNKVSGIEQNDRKVKVILRDGATEYYDLSKESEKKAYEKKYGVYLEKMKRQEEKLREQMKVLQLEQQRMSQNQMEQIQKSQMALESDLLKKNADEQQKLQEALLDRPKNDNELVEAKKLLEKLAPIKTDNQWQGLLDENRTESEKLLLESQLNLLNKAQWENLNKESLKKLQKQLKMQQLELESNMEELQLQQKKIEKKLKLMKDDFSFNSSSILPPTQLV
ncbi:MAG: hypothetical protein JST75_11115 [Bacteroidetes bacterium]|nr:hypothetical protein [Bacteroidota bacterium]